MLGLVIGGLAIPGQPPAMLAAVQVACLLLLQNNAAYCGTRLLADPLTTARARQLAAALDCLSLPLLAALVPPQQGPLLLHPGERFDPAWQLRVPGSAAWGARMHWLGNGTLASRADVRRHLPIHPPQARRRRRCATPR